MGWSLPGDRLICLQRDNLKPELFEKIISPSEAWRHAEQDYIFDDSWYHSRYIVMMELKSYGYPPPALHYGTQAKRQLQGMIKCGGVVCLDKYRAPPFNLFWVDDNGALICRDKDAFLFGGERVIKAFNLAVSQRDYRHSGGKPAPTSARQHKGSTTQPVAHDTLNTKSVGRLLAAGGIYNGNVAGFRQTAEQLGGDAPAGYNQVLNDTTKGLAIAGISVAAGLGIGRLNAARETEALSAPLSVKPAALKNFEKAASSPNRNGLTDAGRALQKHGGREGSVYYYSSQKALTLNEEAQSIVNEILNNPRTKIETRTVFENKQRVTVMEVTAPDGRALRYNADGSRLIGFREPPQK